MQTLRRYTVELSRPPGGWADLQKLADRARSAASRSSRQGSPVRLLRSVFVPEDETCLFVYEASSLGAVRAAARSADLICTRVRRTLRLDAEEES